MQTERVEEGVEGEGSQAVRGAGQREEIGDVEVSEDLEEEFVRQGYEGGIIGKHFRGFLWVDMAMCDGYYVIMRFV
jgi:hypothetical protein